jgi:prepilin-type N-terminal cleavage/methylation domain-containing protein
MRLSLENKRFARTSRRRGFTLLELLLASVCAAMLLSALYYSFDMTISQTQVARDMSGTEDLTRGVVNRLSIDINSVIGPQPSLSGGAAGMVLPYSLEATISGSTPSTGGTGSGGMGGGTSGGTSGSTNSTTATTLLGSSLYIPVQAGVIGGYEGNMNMLVLFTSRVPDIFTSNGPNSLAQLYNNGNSSSNNNVQVPADLRRVVYWLGNNGGLYRSETPWILGVNNYNLSDLPIPDNEGTCLAEEVKNVLFEYYDPYEQSWETSWDGTGGTSPPYSMQPGPPAAIRITLTFEFPSAKGGPPIHSTIVQIFPIFTAPGQTTMTLYNATANGTTSSASGSGSSSGTSAGGASAGGGGMTSGAGKTGGK